MEAPTGGVLEVADARGALPRAESESRREPVGSSRWVATYRSPIWAAPHCCSSAHTWHRCGGWLLTRVLSIPFTILAALKWSFVGFFFNNVVPGLIGGDLPKMMVVVAARCSQ